MIPSSFSPLVLAGTPREMGAAHAQAFGSSMLRDSAQTRLDLCAEFCAPSSDPPEPGDILAAAAECLPAHNENFPELMEEVAAMSEVSGVSIEALLILNGYTDFLDVLYGRYLPDDEPTPPENQDANEGCTSFAVLPEVAVESKPLIGQTWDMNSSALPFVCLLDLQPAGKPRALMLSLAGCVGMIGMNEAGLVVCTNNLRSRHGTPGVFWPFLMRGILACENFSDAESLLRNQVVAGAHNYLLMDAGGQFLQLEKFPSAALEVEATDGIVVHANHCIHPEGRAMERMDLEIARTSSEQRLALARHFLENRERTIGPQLLMELTCLENDCSEHHVNMCPLPDYEMQTCAALVASPATRELWASPGRVAMNTYRRFSL